MGSTEEIPVGLEKVFRIIDENKEAIVDTLMKVVSIPSVSAENKHHDDVKRCIEWTKKVLEEEGLYVDTVSSQDQNVHYGNNPPETPVLQARTAYDVKKNTAMIYAYLDVYPAKKSDGWDTEPFMPEENRGKVYGRGCAAGKGPLVAWLWVLKAFNLAGLPVPVNLRFVIDSTREIGSKAATAYIESKMNRYFYFSTHTVVLSDGSWLEENRPSVPCALRGLCYFEIDVTCAGHDLHSGVYGGTISEGMSDVIDLLNSLTDEDGCISVPGFCDKVDDLTDDEKWTLINARVDVEDLRKQMGVPQLIAKEKAEVLKRMWHCPSLSIHGIQGAYSGSGEMAVIPGHVIGKFSIRTVPIQKSEDVRDCITRHLESEFAKRNSPNRLKVTMTTSCEPWWTYRSTANFRAARAAVKQVYGAAPSMTRSGSSLPVATTLSDRVNMNVIQIPISAASGYVVNEHIPIEDLIRGAKLYAAYCYEVARFP